LACEALASVPQQELFWALAGAGPQQEEAVAAVVEAQQEELPAARFSDFWIRFTNAPFFFSDMMQASLRCVDLRSRLPDALIVIQVFLKCQDIFQLSLY
jgi:hypothetical protein